MVTQYDEKGKIFTQVVSKKPILVIIQTTRNIIYGSIYVRPDVRLKDELDSLRERFLAVTDAVIYTPEKIELFHTQFMVVNIDQILWLMPQEELVKEE